MQHKRPPSRLAALAFPGFSPEALASPPQHGPCCTQQQEEDDNNPCVAKREVGDKAQTSVKELVPPG